MRPLKVSSGSRGQALPCPPDSCYESWECLPYPKSVEMKSHREVHRDSWSPWIRSSWCSGYKRLGIRSSHRHQQARFWLREKKKCHTETILHNRNRTVP
jgi:hypothetical protein